MPISHNHKCIFIHIPKVCGTSIEKMLGMYLPGTTIDIEKMFGHYKSKNTLQHLTMNEVSNFYPRTKEIQDYYKFTFVRNPWDRLVSEYFWIKNSRGARAKKNKDMKSFHKFVLELPYKFNNKTLLEYGRTNCHFRPQIDFTEGVDFIGKMENFKEDLSVVLIKLDQEHLLQNILHSNTTNHKHYQHYYNSETKKIVEVLYEDDIRRFNYCYDEDKK